LLKDLKKTVKHTAVYSLGNLSAKLVGLILLPLYTSYLTTAEYGILSILEATMLFLVAFFGFRLYVAMMKWYTEKSSEEERKTTVFTTLISLLGIVALVNVLLHPFSHYFSEFFFGHDRFASYFNILFITTSIEIINGVAVSVIRLKEKSAMFVIVTLAKLLVTFTLSIYFIVYLGKGVEGIILSQLIGSFVFLLLTLGVLFKNILPKFNLHDFKGMFRFGFPLVFNTISVLMLTLGDRYILQYFHDYSQVGVYSLAYKIAGVINMFFLMSFQMGFLPIAYKMYNKPEAKRFFSKVLTYFTMILIFASLGLTFFSKEMIMIFAQSNDGYWIAYTLVPLLCLTYVFKGVEYVFVIGLHNVKKTNYNALVVLIGTLLNIGLNILLIPYFEMYGAAMTSVLSGLVMTVLFYYFSQKFYPISYEKAKVVKLFVLGGALYAVSLGFEGLNFYLAIVLKFVLLILFPFMLKWIRFYDEIELDRIESGWKKWRNIRNLKENIAQLKIDV